MRFRCSIAFAWIIASRRYIGLVFALGSSRGCGRSPDRATAMRPKVSGSVLEVGPYDAIDRVVVIVCQLMATPGLANDVSVPGRAAFRAASRSITAISESAGAWHGDLPVLNFPVCSRLRSPSLQWRRARIGSITQRRKDAKDDRRNGSHDASKDRGVFLSRIILSVLSKSSAANAVSKSTTAGVRCHA
jgi:hypothetical protein